MSRGGGGARAHDLRADRCARRGFVAACGRASMRSCVYRTRRLGEWGNWQPGRLWLFKFWFESRLPSSDCECGGRRWGGPARQYVLSASHGSIVVVGKRGPRYSESEAREAIAVSMSYAEALRRLGMRPAGGNHKTLRTYAEEVWRISTAHFDPDRARNDALRRGARPLDEVLVRGSSYSRGHLKERLFAHGLKQRRCELCGQGEIWQGRRMSLILDHINGIADDHRLENLQIVCPNCAATLDTHCGRQNRLQRIAGVCPVCGLGFSRRYAKQRYCSRACAARSPGVERARRARRRVARPPRTHLLREVDALGVAGTGRRYGVSDNAIRKWMRQHEREADTGMETADVRNA